jgi:hypothetical protein
MHSPVVIHSGGGVAILRDLVQEGIVAVSIHLTPEAVEEAIGDVSSVL